MKLDMAVLDNVFDGSFSQDGGGFRAVAKGNCCMRICNFLNRREEGMCVAHVVSGTTVYDEFERRWGGGFGFWRNFYKM